ncbi:hypothetical protein PROFUN_05464 [Planoprotostelium fungivorum]|uniref:Uncharacterized protein n=1 Tax=Planoprotostelium fungivorum TaxID=1890364 RepID=A0A2P6NQT5_9EUKA|nr:hypothetical protein PROFUN_05464 [Planoprotostelium fungivorum]
MPRSRSPRSDRTVSKRAPLILRPVYFAVGLTRAAISLWFTVIITAVYLPIAVLSKITGKTDKELVSLEWVPIVGRRLKERRSRGEQQSYSARLRSAASNVLTLGASSQARQLSDELKAKNNLINKLEKELERLKLNEQALSQNILVRELEHQVNPDLRDEYQAEQQLLQILKNRVQNSSLAEEYKEAADRQSQNYLQVIESLRQQLMEELAVIEHQQEDKQTLEKQITVARNLISKLQEDLAKEEEVRQRLLLEQKHKHKDEQERVSQEFQTATDFCRDLRRKLDGETKRKEELQDRYTDLRTQIEQYKKSEEEQRQKLQKLETILKEEQHQLALTQQEREKDIESNKQTIATLHQQIKTVNEKIIIVKDKASENKAKQLQEAAKEKQLLIEKFEQEIKRLQREGEAEKERAAKEHDIQIKLIEELKVKDTDDVQRERTKAAADIKKLQNQHLHDKQALEAKLRKSHEELEAASALLALLKGQYEEEKNKAQTLSEELSRLEEELSLVRSDRDKLQQRIVQHSKELELERKSLSTKLEVEKNTLQNEFEAEKNKLVEAYRKQQQELTAELEGQKQQTVESEKRLEKIKSELVTRIAQLEKDRIEASNRTREAEKLAKTKEEILRETMRLQEAANGKAQRLAASLTEEQKRTQNLEQKLAAELDNTRKAEVDRAEYVKKLELQVTTAKGLIETLKPKYEGDRERNTALLSEWKREKGKMDSQVEQLQKTLAAEKQIALKERDQVVKFETQLRQLGNRNDALQRDVQNSSEAKELTVKKETHKTEVRTVETF